MEDEDISPDTQDPELSAEHNDSAIVTSNTESSTIQNHSAKAENNKPIALREWFQQKWSLRTVQNADPVPDCVRLLAWRLFHDDIVTLIGLRDLWVDRQDRREPTPLCDETVQESLKNESFGNEKVISMKNRLNSAPTEAAFTTFAVKFSSNAKRSIGQPLLLS
ncbi:unnamed protein product [Echinostoma caproni]|uniref:Uncharacterized protein n=1 Tax=Echinostoma caproni TaxID=27848 RepID=A0A3P8GZX9_9TREM|nr:unnamed protein product [Echinostoma caproni]